jgi:hypothetical protein
MKPETQAKLFVLKLILLSTSVSIATMLALTYIPLPILGIAATSVMLIMLIKTVYEIKVDQIRSLNELNSK